MRVCVIGAGVCGLSALRQFSQDNRYKLTGYEQGITVGGLWNYPDGCEVSKDVPETSPYYCRMYRDLRINTPRLLTEFADYPFPSYVDSFPRLPQIARYLQEYADKHGLRKFVEFQHRVEKVEPIFGENPVMPTWSITVRSLQTNNTSVSEFDAVLICRGRYHVPYIGTVPGLENFRGPVFHSSHYRTPEPYQKATVLVIGAGYSGIDVVCGLLGHAKQIIVAHRKPQKIFHDKSNVVEPGPVSSFTRDSAILEDGSVVPVDVIFLCTGYQLDFPFLTDACGLTVSRGQVYPVYRHSINCRYPSMAFLGLVSGPAFFRVLPVSQAKFYKAFLDGTVQLPTAQKMIEEVEAEHEEKLKNNLPPHQAHAVVRGELWALLDKLGKEGGFQPYTDADQQVTIQHKKDLEEIPCIGGRMAIALKRLEQAEASLNTSAYQ